MGSGEFYQARQSDASPTRARRLLDAICGQGYAAGRVPPLLKLVATVYGIVFVAELPDKTALAALVLATRHRAMPVFVGAAGALAVQSLVAVAAGQLLTLLPARPVHIVAGLVFLISAVVMWIRHEEATDPGTDDAKFVGFWGSTWTVFGIVFIAEWGDLTQLATGALAARYAAPVAVFVGATAALWTVAAIAVFVGHRAGKLLSGSLVQRIAAVLFGLIGVALVVGVF
jgi:putative Ca2+/H+ antiporter (TMEM165/GDT1 family)